MPHCTGCTLYTCFILYFDECRDIRIFKDFLLKVYHIFIWSSHLRCSQKTVWYRQWRNRFSKSKISNYQLFKISHFQSSNFQNLIFCKWPLLIGAGLDCSHQLSTISLERRITKHKGWLNKYQHYYLLRLRLFFKIIYYLNISGMLDLY